MFKFALQIWDKECVQHFFEKNKLQHDYYVEVFVWWRSSAEFISRSEKSGTNNCTPNSRYETPRPDITSPPQPYTNSITLMTWTADMHTNMVLNIINSSSRMVSNVVALLRHTYVKQLCLCITFICFTATHTKKTTFLTLLELRKPKCNCFIEWRQLT